MKKTLPEHWNRIEAPLGMGKHMDCWQHKLVSIRVFRSISKTKNGDQWFHLSVSRPDRLPSWDEITKIRDEMLGDGTEAYHVIPKRSDYVNLHRYCLHIWAPVDGVRRVANLTDLIWEDAP